MTKLTHPVTGHRISVDGESVDFWKAAGYQAAADRKAPAKKAASTRKSSK